MLARNHRTFTSLLLCACVATTYGSDTVLHDNSASGISSLTDSGFLLLVNPPLGNQVSVQTDALGDGVDSTAAISDSVGFFTHNPFTGAALIPSPPELNRQSGFTLEFKLQLLSEVHSSQNRAGFSIIVVCSDLKAIEIGFWTERIWAQADGLSGEGSLFTQAEGIDQLAADMNTMRQYRLTVLEDRYVLICDDAILLTGPLRDYTAWPGLAVPFLGTLDPYQQANMVFLGDDTSSASASFILGSPIGVLCGALRSPQITRDQEVGTAAVILSWGTLPGVSYRVDSSPDLGAWTDGDIVTAVSRSLQTTRPFSVGGSEFFRITLDPE